MRLDDEEKIGYLLADVSRLMRRAFQQQLVEGSSLTHAQARVLVYLARCEGLRQVELAEILEIQPITLARSIDQLAELGLVERRVDPVDRRAYKLYLTELAQPQLTLIAAAGAAVSGQVIDDIASSDMQITLKTLNSMREKLIVLTRACTVQEVS